jgi:RNA-directed DNA polymerase
MKVSEMQRKLSFWAEQDKERKFYDLHSLLVNKDWLQTAHEHVRKNRGSVTAGTDGITMKDFEQDLENNLKILHEDLKAGTFEPFPVRRVILRQQKPDGRIKERPLGIPSIRDRVVQEAIRMLLEPIYEANFSRHSYGFRPNRCTMDAIAYIVNQLRAKGGQYFWIIEGDITSYFDTIKHRTLMRLLRQRVKDEKLLRLIWKFLRAGVMEKKLFRATYQGSPQGGILSPLLANIYLHELDLYMERYTQLSSYYKAKRRKAGEANFLYVRYADDFVVMCNGTKEQAMAMKQELTEVLLTSLKLNLSLEKTKVTHINDGFQFLGIWIQRSIGSRGVYVPRTAIPDEAKKKFLSKLKRTLSPRTHQNSVNSKILALNQLIMGWGQYYQYVSSPKHVFNRLDAKVFWLMGHWLGRKYKCSIPKVMKQYYKRSTFGTNSRTLRLLREISTKRHLPKKHSNPYTETFQPIQREKKFSLEDAWTGGESKNRESMDWRPYVIERDGLICAICRKEFLVEQLEVDHKRPRAMFKDQRAADYMENLQVLCQHCHNMKTQQDRQVLSRMR